MSNAQTAKNLQMTMGHMRTYMDLRFAHARRLNPKFRNVEADLKWHQLSCIQQVIARTKPVGENRVATVDLMITFDLNRRRGVFAPKGQFSIQNEVITQVDEALMGGKGGSGVRDLVSFYEAIDPFLKGAVGLLQTWTWWDLPDCAEFTLLEQQFERLASLPNAEVTDQLKQYYEAEMSAGKEEGQGGGDTSKQGIIDFEFYRSEELLAMIQDRREREENYLIIIAMEGATGDAADALIMQLAQHLRALEMLNKSEAIDASLTDYYAKSLQVAPEALTVEAAKKFESNWIAQNKTRLEESLQSDVEGGGSAYDYKKRQTDEAAHKLEQLRAYCKPTPRDQPQDEGGSANNQGGGSEDFSFM